MKNLLIYIITFTVCYLIYFIFVINRKNMLEKFIDGKEIRYLKYKYKVKVNKHNLKKIAHMVSLANSFIISTTVFVIGLIDNLVIEILLGFALIFILIILLYRIIAIIIKKEGI